MSTLSGSSGLPTGRSSCTKCSFMPWNENGKRQNVCATEVAKATSRNPILRQINLQWSWWGIEHLGRKYRMFTTVYISYRGAQGPPFVWHWEGKGLYRIYSHPTGLGTEVDLLCWNRGSRCPWGREGWSQATAILQVGTMGCPPESLGDCPGPLQWSWEAQWRM